MLTNVKIYKKYILSIKIRILLFWDLQIMNLEWNLVQIRRFSNGIKKIIMLHFPCLLILTLMALVLVIYGVIYKT